MFVPLPAIAFAIFGVGIWAAVLRWGPSFGYLDLENRRRVFIFAGVLCFAVALGVWIMKAAH